MKNNIFNYEGEEKEISLSSVKEIKSNTSSNNTQINNNKVKTKFNNMNIPSLAIMHSQKTFGEKGKEKEIEKDNPAEIFERRKQKFHTLMVKQSKIFDNNKKKKRKKGKYKTSIQRDNNKKIEEEDNDLE